ncbi:MAG: hypothetical protein IKB47_01500 [Clostridia bacterium]|nr:hypothetical protein [Clostridia bacterium]
MKKSIFVRAMMASASVIMIVGVLLMANLLTTEEERNSINVHINESSEKTLEFKDLFLLPGESCEYTIKLNGERSKQYDLSFDFIDVEEEKTLKDFARVRIEAGGDVICDELLADAFESENIVASIDFENEKNTEILIVYYLPIDVGNEAKNAEAVFELRLTAKTNEALYE